MPSLHYPTFCLLALLCCAGAIATGTTPDAQPWGYRIGETGETRQGSFCDDRGAALEIARIFARFGARTGFSALSNSPDCATRVHAVTPESLLRQIEIKLESGANYFVNFIQVRASDGTRPVLITTRRLIGN